MNTTATLAKVDWLRFTYKPATTDIRSEVTQLHKAIESCFIAPIAIHETGKGLHGYAKSCDVKCFVNGQLLTIAHIAYGGTFNKNTIMLDIMGSGCTLIDRWDLMHQLLKSINAKITRCDLALDFLEGEVTIENIKHMYFTGEFVVRGRTPSYKTISGGWIDGENYKGATFQIGNRKHGKVARCYEKGRQLGNYQSPWVRIEVELTSRNRIVPHEIILEPDEHFKGSYKPFEKLIRGNATHLKILRTQSETTLEKAEAWLKGTGGKTIDTLVINKYDNDYSKFVEAVRVSGVPKKLQISAIVKQLSKKSDE